MPSVARSFTEYLSERCREAVEQNDVELIRAAERGDAALVAKIENVRKNEMTEAERRLFSVDAVLRSIEADPLTRIHYRKSITKQSIHEKAQIAWIRQRRYPDAVKPKDPPRFENRRLVKGRGTKGPHSTKTLDLHVPSQNVWAVLKHTTSEGGAQDNQFTDVCDFVKQCVAYLLDVPRATERFEFYLDGSYYTPKRFEELAALCPPSLETRVIFSSCARI